MYGEGDDDVHLMGPGLAQFLQQRGGAVFCRNYSGYTQCQVVAVHVGGCRDRSNSTASPVAGAACGLQDSITVRLPAGTQPGTSWLELAVGNRISSPVPVLVAGNIALRDEIAAAVSTTSSSRTCRQASRERAFVANVGLAAGLASWGRPGGRHIERNEVLSPALKLRCFALL